MENTLNINKEIKQVTFTYLTTTMKYEGTCSVTVLLEVTDINAQVMLLDSSMTIGNCSSNGSTTVNIYDNNHKDKIDLVAHEFKTLQSDIAAHYTTTGISL